MNENAELIRALREVANFLEGNPQERIYSSIVLSLFPQGKEELLRVASSGFGTLHKKTIGDSLYALEKRFCKTPEVFLQWVVNREAVCQRVKVGEKELPAEPEMVLPAKPEVIIPAKPARVEPIYEWKCPPSLLEAQP